MRCVERTLGVLDMGLDADRQSSSARAMSVVAGRAAGGFDTAGNGFDARAEQFLELFDADFDPAGNNADGRPSMPSWIVWKRAVMVSANCVLRLSMASVNVVDAAVDGR